MISKAGFGKTPNPAFLFSLLRLRHLAWHLARVQRRLSNRYPVSEFALSPKPAQEIRNFLQDFASYQSRTFNPQPLGKHASLVRVEYQVVRAVTFRKCTDESALRPGKASNLALILHFRSRCHTPSLHPSSVCRRSTPDKPQISTR